MERKVALRFRIAVTIDAMVGKKRLGEAGKVFVDALPRRISFVCAIRTRGVCESGEEGAVDLQISWRSDLQAQE